MSFLIEIGSKIHNNLSEYFGSIPSILIIIVLALFIASLLKVTLEYVIKSIIFFIIISFILGLFGFILPKLSEIFEYLGSFFNFLFH